MWIFVIIDFLVIAPFKPLYILITLWTDYVDNIGEWKVLSSTLTTTQPNPIQTSPKPNPIRPDCSASVNSHFMYSPVRVSVGRSVCVCVGVGVWVWVDLQMGKCTIIFTDKVWTQNDIRSTLFGCQEVVKSIDSTPCENAHAKETLFIEIYVQI